ncbi:MAG: 30S ribosomal protein S18 [Deltaproteobacteria bacterium]|jgi:small subunit ribosomal protein S18|nr:30S ribosomal protein S18 [Deltaproteobacteria bacterium]MBT4089231.1 30S ribosomal protein S18 [Deltaproteobacteria bacterium]MBT4269316.1 30S ribosomal protein S18 [Deltaproteobacteria bacterium]MBT4643246.1 30S ribosomal protein S18 [Deltaproteobacteria bacterium]MBT6498531.1 30S ribosomal protein S18 [Deltaproteobacteria bacterium]
MSKKKRKHYFREKLPTRPCPITIAGIEEIDYKDVELLKMFITDNGKIIPRRISGLNARSQKKITRAIKQARNAALLSFSAGYIVQDEIQE